MVATVLAAPLSSAQEAPAPGPDREASESVLDAFVADVDSLSADFTQELWTAEQQLVETVSGRFAFARPNRFLWHYMTPPEQLVVADGETLWMYDVELAQVTRAPLAELSAANPALLLSGDRSVAESFDVEQTFSLDGRDWIRLVPRESGGDFSSVLVGFDAGVPRELELVDGLNQTTRIELSAIELDPDLAAETFAFEPPAGVHVIGGGR